MPYNGTWENTQIWNWHHHIDGHDVLDVSMKYWWRDDWPQYYLGWCWSLPPCPKQRSHWQSSSAPATGACRRVEWWQSEHFSLVFSSNRCQVKVQITSQGSLIIVFLQIYRRNSQLPSGYLYRVKNTLKASSLSVRGEISLVQCNVWNSFNFI